MATPSDRLVWIDCEMTGLDLEVDELVEIAVIITDYDLTPVDGGLSIVIKPDASALESMGEFVRTMHTESGLIEEIPNGVSVADVRTLALLPFFVVLLLVVRGLPSLLVAPSGSSVRDLIATGLFGATGLPIIVAVTAIGVDRKELDTGTAAALVGAGMLSVLVFPLVALAVRGTGGRSRRRTMTDDVDLPTEG